MQTVDSESKYKILNNKNDKLEDVDIYKFSENVLKQLNKDNISSIPSNYSIYFEKLLEQKSPDFKKKLGDSLEFYEEFGEKMSESSICIEKEIKQGFVQIKSMLQAVALIYKNIGLMKGITKKNLTILKSNRDILAVQNVVSSFNCDIAKLFALMDKHIEVIKTNYNEIGKILKTIEEQTVYDSRYEIYNRKFIINTMQTELDTARRYGYKSSFLIVKVSERILFGMQNLKEKNNFLKNIAKLLLKVSRRSDVVGHYGDGYFVVIMKHTDINGAKLACNRLSKLISSVKQRINDNDVYAKLRMVACELGANSLSMEEMLSKALDSIEVANEDEPIILEQF
ncbi:hypothetical protein CPIN18020_0060 [Campylobacter pinnipediorum subsp. caledonicus]|uniref:GGDEF domain-containing protein n=1 Tax=Campylobacter pinnipediorum TaxID=1965231 RepID=UPI0009955F25|nr:diguanylate cyclase [Campylobacter pinnipediorum]AQW85316.1 hypothetical protein CPIN18020_0060 [Campylobacter pinnipediorum subsp. caledonicus]